MIILRLFKILRHPYTSLKSILNMAAVYVLVRNRQLIRHERVFRDRINPLDYMDDCDILEKFRLPRHVIFDLCNELNDRLEHPTKRSHGFCPSNIIASHGCASLLCKWKFSSCMCRSSWYKKSKCVQNCLRCYICSSCLKSCLH